MVFGHPSSFAVEAFVERGDEFPPTFGGNVVGRMCLHIGGAVLGDLGEPSCVLKALSQHLLELRDGADTLWHPLLAGAAPEQQFQLLDEALFLGGGARELQDCSRLVFLTNVSEAFDPMKGFALCPSPGEVLVLLRTEEGGPIATRAISFTEFSAVAAAFAQWVTVQEGLLLNGSAV